MSTKNFLITTLLLAFFGCLEGSSFYDKPPTSNEATVLAELDTIIHPGPKQKEVLDAFNAMTPPEKNKALSQMSGQQYTTLFTTTEIVNRQFLRHLFDPLRPYISNPCSYLDEVYDLCSYDGIEIWASGSVNRGFLSGNSNAQGYKMSGYDVSFGAHKRLSSYWLLGAAFCYSMQHVNYNVGGSSKCQDALGAIYTLYRPASYYFLTNLTFGGSEDELQRKIKFGEGRIMTHCKPKISQVTFYTEAGKDFCWDCLLIQPFIGIEAEKYWRNSLREHQGAPLNLVIGSKEQTNAFSRLGLHISALDYAFDVNFAFDIAWQYRLTRPTTNLHEAFTRFGGPFEITGIPTERNSIDVCFNASTGLMDGWSIYIQAAGQKWSRVSNYNFTLGLIAQW